MRNQKLLQLFNMLSEDKFVAAESLGVQLNCSPKTVRKLLSELNDILSENGADILAKHGYGYRIEVKDQEKFAAFIKALDGQATDDTIPNTSDERSLYLLEYLLTRNQFVKLDELSDHLFISKKTLTADLKKAEKQLEKYHLALNRKPNHGIRVEGREFDKRLCLVNTVTFNRSHCSVTKNIAGNSDTHLIANCVLECLRNTDINISEIALQNLVVHIYIAIERIKSNCYIPLHEIDYGHISDEKEYQAALKIVEKINKAYHVDFPPAEIAYITIHLAGKRTYSGLPASLGNMVIGQDITDLVTNMLAVVYDAFHYDFRNNLDLRVSLSQHIVPLGIRIQYDMNMKNPLLDEIKKRYALAFAMAGQACTVLNAHYGKELKEDEVGYIALPFALALEREKMDINKKNILIVCSSGQGSAQLLKYRYQEEFSSFISSIQTCDVTGIHKVDFANIDYVFATVPIPVSIPTPIIEVKYFLEDNDIRMMKKVLYHGNPDSVIRYFSPELFLPSLTCGSKDEVLKYMCDYVIQKKKLPESFYKLVMERERLAKTAFGNKVAMPHPYKAIGSDTFVCIGILDKPIPWGEQQVQLVFLTSIEKSRNKNLQNFYQVASKLILSSKYVQRLIQDRSFETLKEIIEQIESGGV